MLSNFCVFPRSSKMQMQSQYLQIRPNFLLNSLNLDEMLVQIYTENWVNSPAQQEDNSWQAFVFVPKDNWYITKASSEPLKPICVMC